MKNKNAETLRSPITFQFLFKNKPAAVVVATSSRGTRAPIPLPDIYVREGKCSKEKK